MEEEKHEYFQDGSVRYLMSLSNFLSITYAILCSDIRNSWTYADRWYDRAVRDGIIFC